MLTFNSSEERQNQCFYLLGTAKSSKSHTNLISNSTSLISNNISLLSDIGQDTCSFSLEPSDTTIMAFGEQAESCGSIASADNESCGSVAYSCGTASVSVSSDSGCSGGGCSYSC